MLLGRRPKTYQDNDKATLNTQWFGIEWLSSFIESFKELPKLRYSINIGLKCLCPLMGVNRYHASKEMTESGRLQLFEIRISWASTKTYE